MLSATADAHGRHRQGGQELLDERKMDMSSASRSSSSPSRSLTSSTRSDTEPDPASERGLPPLARLPVLFIAGAVGAVFLVTSVFGEYWFDELYFVEAGHHFAWGYADQPWLLPLLASVLDRLSHGSMLVLRLPSAIACSGGVVVTALIAREFGGRRAGQLMAAGAYAVSWWIPFFGRWLTTYTLDPFLWLIITWQIVRWVRLREQGIRNDWPLLWAGVVTAVALQIKFLAPVLWFALALSILVVGPRNLLRRPALWLGGAIAVLASVPTLLWQAENGWPYLELTHAVRAASSPWDPVTGLPEMAGLVGTVFALYALSRLFRAPELQPYRFLAYTFLAVVLTFLLTGGRLYYLDGMYGMLYAVAGVQLEQIEFQRWRRWIAWSAYALSAAVALMLVGFSMSASASTTTRPLLEPVAHSFRALRPETRARTAIVANTYPIAATLDYYGRDSGLPPTYSPHRGYCYFGAPPETDDTVLYVTLGGIDRIRPYFTSARMLTHDVWLLEGRTQPWSVLWPRIRWGMSEVFPWGGRPGA
jgi:hypothetical protein